jgi:hypothetical protein
MESHEANEESAATKRTTITLQPGPRGVRELFLVNFEEMVETGKPTEKLKSDRFKVGNHKLRITFYPNGWTANNEGIVDVFLRNMGDEDAMVRSLKITIGPSSKKMSNKSLPAGGPGVLGVRFSLDDCKKALVDGALLVKAEVEMSGKIVTTSSSTGCRKCAKGRCASDFKGIRFDTDNADFVFKCGGKAFPCHKVILCARSSVFKGMLARDWDEAKKGEATIEDVEPEVLEMMLEFIYSGEVAAMEGRAKELLYAADKYGLGDLVRTVYYHCTVFIDAFLPRVLSSCCAGEAVRLLSAGAR